MEVGEGGKGIAMSKKRYSKRNNKPAVTFENDTQDTATAMHVMTTKKLDKPSLMPLTSSPVPIHTSISHAATLPLLASGGVYAKPAE